uniref:DIRP domain-containing protein n=1 Tax=Anopheles melas TaxID=34690 RepID=A0A182TDL8_9DIPT
MEYYDFDSIFRQEKETLYPTLVNSSTTRIKRKRIAKKVRKRVLIGRFSPAFINEKRVELEKCRDLLRFLMANPLIEYTDGVKQWTAPDPIKIGSKVSVMLYTPRLWCCFGEVIDIEYREITMFKVRYEADGIVQQQLLPDYCVTLEEESEFFL